MLCETGPRTYPRYYISISYYNKRLVFFKYTPTFNLNLFEYELYFRVTICLLQWKRQYCRDYFTYSEKRYLKLKFIKGYYFTGVTFLHLKCAHFYWNDTFVFYVDCWLGVIILLYTSNRRGGKRHNLFVCNNFIDHTFYNLKREDYW